MKYVHILENPRGKIYNVSDWVQLFFKDNKVLEQFFDEIYHIGS